MNAQNAQNASLLLSLLLNGVTQLAGVAATLQRAQEENRDVTDDEVAVARAAAIDANLALAAQD